MCTVNRMPRVLEVCWRKGGLESLPYIHVRGARGAKAWLVRGIVNGYSYWEHVLKAFYCKPFDTYRGILYDATKSGITDLMKEKRPQVKITALRVLVIRHNWTVFHMHLVYHLKVTQRDISISNFHKLINVAQYKIKLELAFEYFGTVKLVYDYLKRLGSRYFGRVIRFEPIINSAQTRFSNRS